MKEILFRGKRIDNNEWIEGFYLFTKENIAPIIVDINDYAYVIASKTLGQFTGLTDQNGIKIFEGDILCCIDGKNYPVIFEQRKGAAFFGVAVEPDETWSFDDKIVYNVVGNIYDNPELLKEE